MASIVSSPDVAKENKQQIVETEDLMKTILEQKDGLARRIFSKIGVDNTKVYGEAAGSMLVRDLEGLFQRARLFNKSSAQSLIIELEHLTDEAALAIETAKKFSTQLDKGSSDELQQVTCDEGDETVQFPQGLEVTEYTTLIAVVSSMVKQNYAMQEKIVRSLSLKSSSGELETVIAYVCRR